MRNHFHISKGVRVFLMIFLKAKINVSQNLIAGYILWSSENLQFMLSYLLLVATFLNVRPCLLTYLQVGSTAQADPTSTDLTSCSYRYALLCMILCIFVVYLSQYACFTVTVSNVLCHVYISLHIRRQSTVT